MLTSYFITMPFLLIALLISSAVAKDDNQVTPAKIALIAGRTFDTFKQMNPDGKAVYLAATKSHFSTVITEIMTLPDASHLHQKDAKNNMIVQLFFGCLYMYSVFAEKKGNIEKFDWSKEDKSSLENAVKLANAQVDALDPVKYKQQMASLNAAKTK